MRLRMCISCRAREEQTTLNRFQCKDKILKTYSGYGRSFYICNNCLEDTKKLEKALFRQCKNKDLYLEQLKEIVVNGR